MAISGVLASYIWHVFQCMQNTPIIKRSSLLTFCFYHHLLSPSLCSLSFCSLCSSVGSVCQWETTEQCRVHSVLFFEECLPGVPGVYCQLWVYFLGMAFVETFPTLALASLNLPWRGRVNMWWWAACFNSWSCCGEARKSGDFRTLRECP